MLMRQNFDPSVSPVNIYTPPPPPQMGLEFAGGGWGFCKTKKFKEIGISRGMDGGIFSGTTQYGLSSRHRRPPRLDILGGRLQEVRL